MTNQLQPPLKFPQFMMRRTAIHKNLGPIQSHMNVRTVGREQFFTNLHTNGGIRQGQQTIPEGNTRLTRHFSYGGRQSQFLQFSGFGPGRKPPSLPIISILRQGQFRTNKDNFPIVKN